MSSSRAKGLIHRGINFFFAHSLYVHHTVITIIMLHYSNSFRNIFYVYFDFLLLNLRSYIMSTFQPET